MKLKMMSAIALVLALCLWGSRPAMAGPGMGGGMGGGRMGGGGMGGGGMGAGGMGGPGMGGPGTGGPGMGGPGHGHDDEGYEQGHGHNKDKKHGKHAAQEKAEEQELGGPFFNQRNKHALRSRYGRGLPPGLQKHLDRTGHLPPGLEKQLQRNGHLPPGLEKDLYPVSPKTARRFGPVPPNTKLYFYGRDAILLNEHTGAIVDILRNAY